MMTQQIPCFFENIFIPNEPEPNVFTCNIRPQHRGKSFEQVFEDKGFVKFVLSLSRDEIRSRNLRDFAKFCHESEWMKS